MRRRGIVRKPSLLVATLAGLLLAGPAARGADGVGRKIDNFTLKDTAGKDRSLADFKDNKAVVVFFVGTECPVNNAYLPRLAELHKAYAGKGVQFLAVNANTQDTAERVAEHAKKFAIPFPVLKDEGNVVADRFGARRTPEAFLLDAGGKVCYHGRIDDQFGIGFNRPKPTRRDLAEALDELLAGKQVSRPTTEAAGCLIGRIAKPRADATVTYAKHVSRLLQNHCQECHRPGQIGPMPLLTYRDAQAWAEMIKEVVSGGRMPPWHADPKHGKFANDRRLAPEEKQTLLAWIDQGCPKGDDKDLPPRKEFPEGWRMGKPDQVFTMDTEYTVPAAAPKSGIPYKYFMVPTKFDEDRWVQAAEARPGNRAVVHHILVYILDPKKGKLERTIDGIGSGLLVAFAPGDQPLRLGPGEAKKVPKDSVIVFQMHYTPNGTEQADRSSVGVIFAKEPPKLEVKTRAVSGRRLEIPPGDDNYKVTSTSTFDQDTLLTSLMPHMHLRGKSFAYRAVYPDGKAEVLLTVPRFDFGWQQSYLLDKPLPLPAGTRIECTAYFDNSAKNPNNPDPTKTVRWGDQTWDEMMIGFLDYTTPVK